MVTEFTGKTLRFLTQHGYLSKEVLGVPALQETNVNQVSQELEQILSERASELSQALTSLQSFYGIDTTGKIDEATSQVLQLPRCTNSDFTEDGQLRSENYSTAQRWEKNYLTWRVTKYSDSDITPELVDQTLERAFALWSRYANLTFEKLDSGMPDLEIRFEEGEHGDGDAFDSSGGTLAHAFFPRQGKISGDIHFDDSEYWTLGSYSGVNLTQVAVHEIGHALGLEHTSVRGAIMFPSYEGYRKNLDLAPDDVRGIQSLYGPPESGEGRGPMPPENPWDPTLNVPATLGEICNTICTIV